MNDSKPKKTIIPKMSPEDLLLLEKMVYDALISEREQNSKSENTGKGVHSNRPQRGKKVKNEK